MSGRSMFPAPHQPSRRVVVRQIHWRAVRVSPDWISAHRAARIDAGCQAAQERAIRTARGRWRQC